MAKKSFVMLEIWGTLFDSLSCENAGILIKAIYDYEREKNVHIDDPVLCIISYDIIRFKVREFDDQFR